jgi:hypothetical protein
MNVVPGVDRPTLKRYLDARKAISKRATHITNVSHILMLLEHCDDDVIPVCPQVLAEFADMINSDICSILEQLDQFIYVLDAEKQLNGEI